MIYKLGARGSVFEQTLHLGLAAWLLGLAACRLAQAVPGIMPWVAIS